MPAANPTVRSRSKTALFWAIFLLLPVILLGMMEGTLRLAGMGGYPPVFRRVGQTSRGELVITDQAGAASFFFANRDRPGYNDQYSFYEPKSANTVRIVFVGESATKGFPQPRNLAASSFLEAMLQDAWPDRKVEIINLGTTAVASFPVREMMTESLAFAPDLVVIQTGHNEFFGTYGVASVGWAGAKPWRLQLTRFIHSLAIVQALGKFTSRRPSEDNRTLMEQMVGRAQVGMDDWRRTAAVNNLYQNVCEMIARGQARGVPVLICTMPTNERGLAPIGRDPEAAAPGASNARAHFATGTALFAQQHFAAAHTEFLRARDLDPMPWRATSAANDALRRAARDLNARLCDLEGVFQTNSPGGSIGWELMDDHVHPTLRGQALVAEAILESLAQFQRPLHVSAEARARLPDWEIYAQRLGDNPYERYGVAHMMRVIFGVPFMKETNPDAFARFTQLAESVEKAEPPEILEALREYQSSRPHAGGKRPISAMVARVLMRQQRFAEAGELYRSAQRGVPDYTSWYLEYVYFALVCEEKLQGRLTDPGRTQAAEAIEQGKFLLAHGFSETGFTERHVGRLHQLRGEFAEAIPFLAAARRKLSGLDLVAADQALVVSFVKTGQFAQAREVAGNGVAHAGQFAPLYQQMLNELPAFEQAVRAAASTNAGNHGTTPTR